jgi:hypothetical protein
MRFYKYLTRGLIVTLAALHLTPEINARELRLDRSIFAGLRHQSWQKDLPQSLAFIFSKDNKAVYSNISDPIQLSDFARTTVMHFSQNLKRDDGVTCNSGTGSATIDLIVQFAHLSEY